MLEASAQLLVNVSGYLEHLRRVFFFIYVGALSSTFLLRNIFYIFLQLLTISSRFCTAVLTEPKSSTSNACKGKELHITFRQAGLTTNRIVYKTIEPKILQPIPLCLLFLRVNFFFTKKQKGVLIYFLCSAKWSRFPADIFLVQPYRKNLKKEGFDCT